MPMSAKLTIRIKAKVAKPKYRTKGENKCIWKKKSQIKEHGKVAC